jgi:predicted ribosomally synthesized peptide with SipW-like signal peptide
MKKILLSLMIIAVVGALIGVGIFATFNDTETATNNTFTAGTLNLEVGSADPCTETISISALVPGATGNAGTWLTRNDGSIAGNLIVGLSTITNNDNEVLEPESASDIDGNVTGELGAYLKVAFWMDVDKDGTWTSGDYYLNSALAKVSWASGGTLPSAAYDILDNYSDDDWIDGQIVAASTDAGNFRTEYDLPSATGNVVQSDSCVFTITFTLSQ